MCKMPGTASLLSLSALMLILMSSASALQNLDANLEISRPSISSVGDEISLSCYVDGDTEIIGSVCHFENDGQYTGVSRRRIVIIDAILENKVNFQSPEGGV